MNDQINQIRTSTLFNRLLKSSNLEQFMKDNAYYMQLMRSTINHYNYDINQEILYFHNF